MNELIDVFLSLGLVILGVWCIFCFWAFCFGLFSKNKESNYFDSIFDDSKCMRFIWRWWILFFMYSMKLFFIFGNKTRKIIKFLILKG